MAEFTGNVHSLELTLPNPAPAADAGTVFAVGRTFGEADGCDLWIDGAATTTYDPPGGDPLTLDLFTLLAVTHGWLRFVPAGSAVPGVQARTGGSLVLTEAAVVLSVWPTLRDSLERMAELGNVAVPQVAAGRGGRPVVEHLVYVNVDAASVHDAADALIAEAQPSPTTSVTERAAMVAAFLAGDLPILARAGRVLGQAATGAPAGVTPPAGAGTGWRRLTLLAADRFGHLFDAAWLLRRIRDLGHVVEIPLVVDKTLIPSRAAVRDHPLPALTPARRIVDWRDTYASPKPHRAFYLEVAGTDLETATPKDTGARGLWVGATDSGDPTAVTTVVVGAVADHVAVGTLPNAPRSAFRLTRHVLTDDYLVLSEVDLAEWFPPRPAATPPVEPLRHYTQGNRATALVDGQEALWYAYRVLRRTFRDDDFEELGPDDPLGAEGDLLPAEVRAAAKIWIAGWKLSPHLHLRALADGYVEIDFDPAGVAPIPGSPPGTPGYDPRNHVMGILRAAIDAGVDVRALLWRQLQVTPSYRSNNSAAVAAINAASSVEPSRRGQAIIDDVNRTTGSHHQKAVVVENADGRVAFLGGIDLATGRWDSTMHVPNEPRSQSGLPATPEAPWSGWHDLNVAIEGPAVDDVETNFRQRWNANPHATTEGRTPTPARPTPLDPLPDASHFVQINRTYPAGVPTYAFVPHATGEPSALTARLGAIRKARSTIHLEEQYLIMVHPDDYTGLLASPNPLAFTPTHPDTIGAALRERIVGPDPVRVTILIPKTLEEEPEFGNMVLYELRRRFIRFLTFGLDDATARERLLVFHLRNSSGVATYVHAKALLVDDTYASVGSSNAGFRSMTYDSEINCDVVDGALRRGKRPYATDLRVRLWAEHLRLDPSERHLVLDIGRGFELLRRAAEDDWPRPHAVVAYDPDYYGPYEPPPVGPPLYNPSNATHEVLRRHFVDPDGRSPDDPALDFDALLALFQSL
jgi:phosphatidylserine/phosphatidylglycerophosphate/cardiolipin synthase-like enzyme